MDLREVADRLEITEVCTRLHWCVDHRDWDGLDDLLADHVSFPTPAELAEPDFDPGRYRRSRAEVKAAYPGLLAGLITQHLIAGHQVEIDGDRAVCRAHSINVHLPEGEEHPELVLHGNEYRFELARTPGGWRIDGRQTWIRWRWGDEAHYDVDRRLDQWSQQVRPRG
ncbi:MAG TPA: nuclear transport factor 2 family protein [Trebonia sp.]|nr:nuclear transport factor 2 family protein [Trebonia sp.]